MKEGRFSAVAVPPDINEPITRVQAFNRMPELLANYFGAAGLPLLREHAEFRDFPIRHG